MVVRIISKRRRRDRPATQEQIREINDGLKRLGLGDSIDDFVKKFSIQAERASLANSLTSDIQTIQDAALLAGHNGTLQPRLEQNLLQQININPLSVTGEELETMLLNPAAHADRLNSVSQYLSYVVGNYNRALYYFSQIKSFNYELLPYTSMSGLTDEEKKTYRHSRSRCLETLRKINVKYQFQKIDLEVMFSGVATYYIKQTDESIEFLLLPSRYVYLVSPWVYGYKAVLDLTIFDEYIGIGSISIPELSSAYKKFVDMRNASLSGAKYSDKELTTAQYYPLDPEHFWTFTFDPIHPDKVPPLASSFGVSLDTLTYRRLLKDKTAFDLFKVLALKIPLNKENSKTAINYKEAAAITQIIQSVLPDNIRVFTSPFDTEPISTAQQDEFETVVRVSEDTFNTAAGVQAGLFGGGDLKQSMALLVSADVDYTYVEHMYSQYENCINFILSRASKKYKFGVHMFGNKLRYADDMKLYGELMASKNTPATRLFASMGYPPETVLPLLEMEDDLGIKDLMKPMISAFQHSNVGNDVGREKLDRTEITPSTEEGLEYD